MLTHIYTAVLVKNNNWPSSVHCKALTVGWEAAAVTLEAVYTVMCSMSPQLQKKRKDSREEVNSYRETGCQVRPWQTSTMGTTILERLKAEGDTQLVTQVRFRADTQGRLSCDYEL